MMQEARDGAARDFDFGQDLLWCRGSHICHADGFLTQTMQPF